MASAPHPLEAGFSVCRAVATDVAAVAAILSDAIQYKIKRADRAWGSEVYAEPTLREAMSHSEIYVIRVGDEAIGTFCLQWEDEYYWGKQPQVAGYLHKLATKDNFHGLGIGALAIDWAMKKTVERGRQFLRLDCEAKNAGLCRYYERQGFVCVGQKALHGGYEAALYQRAGDLLAI